MATSSTASTTSTRSARRRDESQIAASLLVGMGAKDPTQPDYQLGAGCLVDQLVGQYMAHVCGLGYLVDQAARAHRRSAAS